MLCRALAVAALAALLIAAPAQAELAAPKPKSPAPGATVDSLPPLEWARVARAVRYEVQVAADARFGSIVTDRAIKTGNTVFTVPEAVADGDYFWRVRAIDAKGKAGRWSADRKLVKAWREAPQLATPTNSLVVSYPHEPLVLRWSDVRGATRYVVSVSSDPSLAQSVIGDRPVETAGTNYSPGRALAPGTYYWAVQPLNARGHKGTRSAVGKFVWGWNSGVALADPQEMRGDARVAPPALSDPELSWSAVPGASGYEIQVNFVDSFSGGSEVESATTIGTRYSPRNVLPNNTYYWRVRPLDVNGNPSGWSETRSFFKSFDTLAPTVPGLRVIGDDGGSENGLPVVQHPLFDWDAVPGASGYEIQVAPYQTAPTKFCDWSARRWARTPNTAWSELESPGAGVAPPGPTTWGAPILDRPEINDPRLEPGGAYCVRVMAVANFRYGPEQDDVISEWTYLDPFVYRAPEQVVPSADDAQNARMDAGDYLDPVAGGSLGETPVLRWKPVPAARGYWVVVARDAEFTNVPEVAFTHEPQHALRTTLKDENTAYWWVVLPALNTNGSGVPGSVADNTRRSFDKASSAPGLLEPAAGAVVSGQPRFHWTGATGAKQYKLQVSSDETFKDTSKELDTVVTASTAYTPTKTYPVDTVLYWRVMALAVQRNPSADIELRPSAAGTFRRTLGVPIPAATNAPGGSTIPALRWSVVPGAVAYDVHVDFANGEQKDFQVRSTAFTPVTWFGTGVWRWKVRAVFPGDTHGAYSDPVPFARFIPAPEKAAAERGKDRVLIGWEPLRNVENYRVEIASDSSFGRIVDRDEVDGTAWAPDLSRSGFLRGGRLYWRVAALDEGNNVGAFAGGTLTFSRRLVVTTVGKPRPGRSGRVTIKVVDAGRRPVAGARVVLAGAGVKVARKTSRSGRLSLKIRPARRGTISIRATRKGFTAGNTKLRAR